MKIKVYNNRKKMNAFNLFYSRFIGSLRIAYSAVAKLLAAKAGCLILISLFWPSVLVLRAATYYVATNGPGPSPYTNWATAASNIQDAISMATTAGDIVLVSNGVYATGGVTNWPAGSALTNRVAITNTSITVRSANNDPTNTIIKGAYDPGATNGPAAVRCVYITYSCQLIGFTLTNGATLTAGDMIGGGVYGPTDAIVSNCVIANNSAIYGGGVRGCTLRNSTVIGNFADYGGGSRLGIMYDCLLISNSATLQSGGGTWEGDLFNCTLIGNTAASSGGGEYGVVGTIMSNCIFIGNAATNSGGGANFGNCYNCLFERNTSTTGGGAQDATLYNCTVVSNISLAQEAFDQAGGVQGNSMKVYNSIVYFNISNSSNKNWKWANTVVFTNTCTTPAQPGWVAGNITNDPRFAGANNYRLGNNSPCINAGTNQAWMPGSFDLDSLIRIRYGTVDMGAYEYIYEGTVYSIR